MSYDSLLCCMYVIVCNMYVTETKTEPALLHQIVQKKFRVLEFGVNSLIVKDLQLDRHILRLESLKLPWRRMKPNILYRAFSLVK